MVAVNQNDLRVKNVQNLITSLTDDTGSYTFMGRPSQWEYDISNPVVPRQEMGDMSPPYPDNNWKDYYRTWNQMLSMKLIRFEDVHVMIPRINWASGVVYDMYRHDYNKFTRSYSNAQNLYDALFFVINQNRFVYVCLDNNNNSQSTVEPLATSDEPFYTTDGYQWLRLYRVGDRDYRNCKTNNFIPISHNLVNKRPEGAIYTVKVDSPGGDYTSRPPGRADELAFYYCNIVGDGVGAIATVSIFNGGIDKVRIADPGRNYTYGRLDFRANRVYATLTDLYEDKNALNPLGNGGLVTSVIISPPGGWGYEREMIGGDEYTEVRRATTTLARQLGGTRVGVFSDFKGSEGDFIENTTFRQAGILQDAKGYKIEDAPRRTISVYKTVKVQRTTNSDSSKYIIGEMIIQDEARGQVVGCHLDGDDIWLKYIQDPFLHCSPTTGRLHEFEGDSVITGDTSGVTSVPDTSFTGFDYDQEFVGGYSQDEIERYKGSFTYIDNSTAIRRDPTQTERLSIIIEY